jgi:uncharacterized membrane protein
MGDKISRRKMFFITLIIITVMAFLCALAFPANQYVVQNFKFIITYILITTLREARIFSFFGFGRSISFTATCRLGH